MLFFFKQKTAYEIGTGDWSSDVCSSDLMEPLEHGVANSCKSVSNHGTVGIWGCKQLEISFKPWNRWNMGLQTVANQFLNMEPL